MQYASTILQSNIPIIKHLSKMLLFHNSQPWEKNFRDPYFDVAMGCYDGANDSELVRLFYLKTLSNIIDKPSIGLYLHDGLTMFEKLIGPQTEQWKKKISKSVDFQ